MNRLTNDEFFAQLARLFDSRKGRSDGQVVLSQKRLSPTPTQDEASSDGPLADLHPSRPLPVLVRATNAKGKEGRKEGRKIKLATLVDPDALPQFYDRYADVCKVGMAALKPRDRSKRKAKAKKKKPAAAAS